MNTHFAPPWWLAAILAATPVLPIQAAEQFGDHVYYFGELHAHTGRSADGGSADLDNCPDASCGNHADYFDNARHVAGLDFAAITDHVNGNSSVTETGWAANRQLAMDGHAPNEGFVAILGGEMDVVLDIDGPIGHKNYLFFGHDSSFAQMGLHDIAFPGVADFCDEVWEQFHGVDAEYGPLLLLPHHPAATLPRATDWSCHDEELSPVVEIYSSHGNSRTSPDYDPYDPLVHPFCLDCAVDSALSPEAHGLRLGIVGGTDTHDSWPGLVCHRDQVKEHPYGGSLTGLYLPAGEPLTRLSIYGALRARHTYATTGPRWPALLTIRDGDGNQLAATGDVLAPPPPMPITVHVSLPPDASPYIARVKLFDSVGEATALDESSPGEFEITYDELDIPWHAYAIVTIDGDAWHADQGIACDDGGEDGAEKIWTSPIWIEEPDTSDDDGDGLSEADGDCDDEDPAVFPGAEEVANGIDDDCDGLTDEDTDAWDADGDGYSAADGDCDESNPTVFPGSPYVCDGIEDTDCDGRVDEYEADRDGDGHDLCGTATGVPDCDDGDPTVHPGAPWICDGIWDNDCDWILDENEGGGDGDWITECAGDCDPRNPAVHPYAGEHRNGIDDDCDGQVDEGFSDVLWACAAAPAVRSSVQPWILSLFLLLLWRIHRHR